MDKTLDALMERVFELEVSLGEESSGSMTFSDAIAVIRERISLMTSQHSSALGALENVLLSFQGDLDNCSTLKNGVLWFESTASQIWELIESLEEMRSKIPDNFDAVLTSVLNFPKSRLAVERLQYYTEQILHLVLNSFLIVHRFIYLTIAENNLIMDVTQSLRDLKRKTHLIEKENFL